LAGRGSFFSCLEHDAEKCEAVFGKITAEQRMKQASACKYWQLRFAPQNRHSR
jgi:hypothetical protein